MFTKLNLRQSLRKNTRLTLSWLFLTFVLVTLFLVKSPAPEVTGREPKKIAGESLAIIELALPGVVHDFGVPGALKWIKTGFSEEKLNMFQCHTLTHLVGHLAFDYYRGNLEATVAGQPVDLCEGGYQHGLEAGIVESSKSYQETLYKLCPLLLKESGYGTCYHGAGHAFMTPNKDVSTALASCDGLKTEGLVDLSGCYTGVFSEYTNLIGGYDGHTGLPLAQGAPIKFTETPIKFCAKFDLKYQVACALEVSGYGLGPGATPEKIEASLKECVVSDYSQDLEEACLQSMAAVTTQHGLPLHSIKPPVFIYSLESNLRQAYIRGVVGETQAFIQNGQDKDWRDFCASFDKGDQVFCEQLVS